jgi:hypothetical protein
MRSAIMGVEPILIRIVVVNNGKGGGKARTRQMGSRISRSITSCRERLCWMCESACGGLCGGLGGGSRRRRGERGGVSVVVSVVVSVARARS